MFTQSFSVAYTEQYFDSLSSIARLTLHHDGHVMCSFDSLPGFLTLAYEAENWDHRKRARGQRASTRTEQAGYEVKVTGKGNGVRETAGWGEVLILAVPYTAVDAALAAIGNAVDGKTVVDVTNVLGADGKLALGFSTSGAEQLQKKAPSAKVVKAFNTIFAQNMSTGKVREERLACMAAGDDEKAKADVLELARAIGFDAIDAGPLVNARWLESLGYLIIQLGYVVNKGLGAGIGFALVR